jgi:hypothetical protein
MQERVHVNRIKALCAPHGIDDYQPLRDHRQAQLDSLHAGGGRASAGAGHHA